MTPAEEQIRARVNKICRHHGILNGVLEGDLAAALAELDRLRAERKPLPLSNQQYWDLWDSVVKQDMKGAEAVAAFARAVERAHGITGD